MDNLLHLVGLSRRAGRLAAGEEPVHLALKSGKAVLVLVAGDAAENSLRRVTHWAEEAGVPWCQIPHTKEELGGVLGCNSCALLSLTDLGLAAAAARALCTGDQNYAALAQDLSDRAETVQSAEKARRAKERERRRKEAKPWAAPSGSPQKPAAGRKRPNGKPARHGTK